MRRYIQANPDQNSEAAHYQMLGLFSQQYNQNIISSILIPAMPLIKQCFPVKNGLMLVFDFLIYGVFTKCLKFIVKYIVRAILAALFTSLGIMWNESLVAVDILRDISLYFIEHFERIFNIKFPILNIPRLPTRSPIELPTNNPHQSPWGHVPYPPVDYPIVTPEEVKSGYFMSILGIALIGITLTLVGITVADIYYPEQVKNIPVVSTIADTIYCCYHVAYDYFTGKPTHIPDGTGAADTFRVVKDVVFTSNSNANVFAGNDGSVREVVANPNVIAGTVREAADAANATGSISRTSSGGSDVTVRPSISIQIPVTTPGEGVAAAVANVSSQTPTSFTPGHVGFGFRFGPGTNLPLPENFINQFS